MKKEEKKTKNEEAKEVKEETKASETEEKAEEQKSEAKTEGPKAGAKTEEPKAEEKKAEASKEEESLQTQFLRLSADFQNYKRRVEKEKSDIYAFANEKIVLQLLDVIDNFDRAMEIQAPDQKSVIEGFALIRKQLGDILEKNNVEEIKALGEEFDPAFHNAVQTEDSSEYKSGQITKVFQKGYMLNKKVIRPSMVVVAN